LIIRSFVAMMVEPLWKEFVGTICLFVPTLKIQVPFSQFFCYVSDSSLVFSSTFKQYGVKPTYTKNIWHDWTTDDFGHYAAKGRAVHVFWNSEYQGVSHLRQTVGSGDMDRWYGGGSDNFTTIAAGPKLKSGNLQIWNNIISATNWKHHCPVD
jgi:hypothetical protein